MVFLPISQILQVLTECTEYALTLCLPYFSHTYGLPMYSRNNNDKVSPASFDGILEALLCDALLKKPSSIRIC